MIYLPYWVQWLTIFSTALLVGVLLVNFIIIPAYQLRQQQLSELENHVDDMQQKLNDYRRKGPHYLLKRKITQLGDPPKVAFSQFILSYRQSVKNWQEDERQQRVTLLLSWPEFLNFWGALVDLKRNAIPSQLQFSAQDDLILVQLFYDKT